MSEPDDRPTVRSTFTAGWTRPSTGAPAGRRLAGHAAGTSCASATRVVGLIILVVPRRDRRVRRPDRPVSPPDQVLIGVERRRQEVVAAVHPCPRLPGRAAQHLMGTDSNVRDEFSRVIHGARVSLFVGFATVGFAILIGALIGLVAGYAGGWIDN